MEWGGPSLCVACLHLVVEQAQTTENDRPRHDRLAEALAARVPSGSVPLNFRVKIGYVSARYDHKLASGSAQEAADRIRALREELARDEVQSVLALTPDQQQRFDEWSRAKLAALAQQFDVDTTASQKRVSWGMLIASTLGGLAICAAIILFFTRYWGYLDTWAQMAIVIPTPLVFLLGAEFMARRERTRYITGLLALVALASFIMNLVVVGNIFNIISTERALLAWGMFAILLAYRYGLRMMLAVGLVLLMSYMAAAYTAQMGYHWLEFYDRPEHFLLLGLLAFAIPIYLKHSDYAGFAPVYRLVGALTFLIASSHWPNGARQAISPGRRRISSVYMSFSG